MPTKTPTKARPRNKPLTKKKRLSVNELFAREKRKAKKENRAAKPVRKRPRVKPKKKPKKKPFYKQKPTDKYA